MTGIIVFFHIKVSPLNLLWGIGGLDKICDEIKKIKKIISKKQ
jgi:hypothetical protein